MDITEFNGIVAYHDGIAVSDYCNVVPLGSSIIDRQGEYCVDPTYIANAKTRVIETFVDSKRNIYIATTAAITRYSIDVLPSSHHAISTQVMSIPVGEIVSFCESSTKPSQVYCCTNGRVWYWNTEALPTQDVAAEYLDRCQAYTPIEVPCIADVDSIFNKDAIIVDGWWPTVNNTNYNLDNRIKVSRVTWFDNRLVLVEASKNTVWLSEVDPSRFIYPVNGKPSKSIVTYNAANSTYLQSFIPHYYSSTASSAVLVDAIAFAGQLYFLNDTSIEVWSATGNGDNPIQHNSQNTLYYGGRSPVIVADTLYLICRDAIHNDFIAAIGQNGQIAHVSNTEIERRLQPAAAILKPLSIRDQSMIVVYRDSDMTEGYSVTTKNLWWRYFNGKRTDEFVVWSIVNYDGVIYGVSNRGFLVRLDESTRVYLDARAIPRNVTGAFLSFVGRKILRTVEIICDTGIYYEPSEQLRPKFYLRVSFDRGMNFGPIIHRSLGAPGKNDRCMVWRNCGSGNSILLQFGTSDNVRFQIYGLHFDLT